jgi:hypothetical protein
MTAGHFGLAAVVKSSAPRVPLWALMVSTYLLDVVFIVLASAGLESFTPIDPAQPAYGGTLIQAYYSHSLLGAALIAVIAGLLAGRAWGKRAGVVIGAVVFSHWLLDLVVHRPAASAVVELALALAGAYLYYRSALRAPALSGQGGQRRNYALIAAGITGLLIVLLLTADVLSLPLLIPVGLMLLLIVLGGWLDSHLNWSLPAT